MLPVKGYSMIDAGIHECDIIAAERTQTAKSGDFVVAMVDDEFTLKELATEQGALLLKPTTRLIR